MVLHDLLFALVGFTGDIIVERNGSYCVRPGFDLLDEGRYP